MLKRALGDLLTALVSRLHSWDSFFLRGFDSHILSRPLGFYVHNTIVSLIKKIHFHNVTFYLLFLITTIHIQLD